MQKYQSSSTKDWKIATELTAPKKRQIKVIHVSDTKAQTETITITIDKTPPMKLRVSSDNFSNIHLGNPMSVFPSPQKPTTDELKKIQEREENVKNRHQQILESMKEPSEGIVIVKKSGCCRVM